MMLDSGYKLKGLSEYLQAFRQAFSFIAELLGNFITLIKSSPVFYVPLIAFLLVGAVFAVVYIFQEASNQEYAEYSLYYTDPYKYANKIPNYYDLNKFNRIPALIRFGVKKHKNKQDMEERKRNLMEDWQKVDEYFKNNPRKFKVSFNGHTFYREGWEKQQWDNDGKIRETYVVDQDGKVLKKTRTFTEYVNGDVDKTSYHKKVTRENTRSYDLQKAIKEAEEDEIVYEKPKRKIH